MWCVYTSLLWQRQKIVLNFCRPHTHTLMHIHHNGQFVHMLFWFASLLNEGGTSQSPFTNPNDQPDVLVESLTKQSPECVWDSCQQHSRDVMTEESSAEVLLQHPDWDSPKVCRDSDVRWATCWPHAQGGWCFKWRSSLFECLLVGAEALAICLQGLIRHSWRNKEGKGNQNLAEYNPTNSHNETKLWGFWDVLNMQHLYRYYVCSVGDALFYFRAFFL